MSSPLFKNAPIGQFQGRSRKTKKPDAHPSLENAAIPKYLDSFHLDVSKHNVSDPRISELREAYLQTAFTYPPTSNGKEGDSMDESTNTLLNRLDKDMRDHKQEIRDRDASILSDARERELRYREEMKTQQELYLKESKEREERLERMIMGISSDLKDVKRDIKEDMREIKSEMAQTTKHVQSMATTNKWGNVATIIALGGIVVAMIIALVQISSN